ncbi:MAG: hypothetical protein ACR2NZ_11415 [Rubripirellula sp.]
MRVSSHYRLALVAWSALILSGGAKAQTRAVEQPSQLVELLDHELFQTRETAARLLRQRGREEGTSETQGVETALRQGLLHDSMEVRVASRRLLDEIELARRDQQLEKLLNPRCPASSIDIAGWSMFSRIAGEDMDARRFFKRLPQRHQDTLAMLDQDGCQGERPSAMRHFDPWRMTADDTAGWALLLLSETDSCEEKTTRFNFRLGTALSSSPMGPSVADRTDARVLKRLIDHWLRDHEQRNAQRDRLLIAMRYGCFETATEICAHVLQDRTAPASTEVTALLAASALGRSDLERQAMARLHDSRTAHVWQLIASRKVKIRTQVRDVALALLLHQRGIDPRQVGYRDLQADPTLVFRDHSLGFPDRDARVATQAAAAKLLGPGDVANPTLNLPKLHLDRMPDATRD